MADTTLSKRAASFDSDIYCFVCQTHKRDPKTRNKSDSAVNVQAENIEAVRNRYNEWRNKSVCPADITAALAVLEEAFSATDTPHLKWHRNSCRANFMSQNHIDRFPNNTACFNSSGLGWYIIILYDTPLTDKPLALSFGWLVFLS